MNDWARDYRETWLMNFAMDERDHMSAAKAAIEGAIRGALAKAARVAEGSSGDPDEIVEAIRALGAAKKRSKREEGRVT